MIKGIIATAFFWTATAVWGFFGWLGACVALVAWMGLTSGKEVAR